MSVPSNKRDLSKMEFYKNAMYIRLEITKWLMRDFGQKKRVKDIKHTIKDISEEEQKTIDGIFLSHNQSTTKEFECVYPNWFVESERKIIIEVMWQMMNSIISANSIYPLVSAELDLRRCKQDEAISAVHHLYYELEYIQRLFPQNLNYFTALLEALDREDHLLKGWRQSDNKTREKLKKV